MREIGSEFWTLDLHTEKTQTGFVPIGVDSKLLMSGRTAIDYILNEIDDKKKIVYMPNFCCESMIRPFIDNRYQIKYYDVDPINNVYNIDVDTECSVFFAMSYFGYSMSNMDCFIEKFNQRKITVIEDITHRLLSKVNYCAYSTYLVASMRKWFPLLSGGLAVAVKDKFMNDLSNYTINNDLIQTKRKAMDLKKQYINGNISDKAEFLELFSQSNRMINEYKNMKTDDISIDILKHLDIDKIRETRINNSILIENMLKTNKKIKLLYTYRDGDCPLFVPIAIKNRDIIRKALVSNSIYLPVHWPNFGINNDIYDCELSLVNDQRYSEDDIREYVNKLIEMVGD